MEQNPEPFADIDVLVDLWCERRALAPLRLLLPVYPLTMGLTDDWQALYRALKFIRSEHGNRLPKEEQEVLHQAIVSVENRLFGG